MSSPSYKDKEVLRNLFHDEGLTQSEMAERLDCSHGTVSNWMRKHGIETRKEQQYECHTCGDIFSEYPSQVNSHVHFCSMDCQAVWQSEVRVGENSPNWEGGKNIFVCDNCGEDFEEWESKLRWEGKFCGDECRIEASKEPGSPLYYGPEWDEIAEQVREKVGECQAVGCEKERSDNGSKLHIHHLKPVRVFENPEDAHFEENLVALCAKHHQRIESKENQLEMIENGTHRHDTLGD